MRSQEAEIDRDVAALLTARAFTEIRHLAGGAQHAAQDNSPDEALERIRFLANLEPQSSGRRTANPQEAVPSGQVPWELRSGLLRGNARRT